MGRNRALRRPRVRLPVPGRQRQGSWDWTASTWQLSLLPGIAAAYGGLILLGLLGTVRFAPALGAFVALAAGAWFVLGAEFSRLWTSPPPDGSGSDWMVIATNVGYHEGLGLAISSLSAFALGLLALLPERAPAVLPVQEQPAVDNEPILCSIASPNREREYEDEPVAPANRGG